MVRDLPPGDGIVIWEDDFTIEARGRMPVLEAL
jgi:hypothetical protein